MVAINNELRAEAARLDKIVADNIKLLREKHNLTQKDVADKLGISFQQVQKYESGVNRISAGNLLLLAKILNIPVDHFYAGEGNSQAYDVGYQKGISDAREIIFAAFEK